MNKEPIGLYIFRFVLGLGLFAFMAMLYWSSALIELDMKNLRSDLSQLKNDVFTLRADVSRIREDVLQSIIEQQRSLINTVDKGEAPNKTAARPASTSSASPPSARNRSKADPSLPNLLEEDPFYAGTLQKLLPPNFKPRGTLQSATIGKYEDLHPFSNWAEVVGWNDMCNVSVAKGKFGRYETLSPNMALKMEARKEKGTGVHEFWVHLRDDVYWQPLRPDFFPENLILAPQFLRKNKVTAHDYKFYLDAIMNPDVQEKGAVALRTYFIGIKEIEIIDDFTFVVRWHAEMVKNEEGKEVPKIKYIAKQMTGALRPLASFVFKYFSDGKKIIEDDSDPNTYRTNSVWAQNFSQHWARHVIISCGPWIFDGKTDRQIRFKRNPDFYFPYEVLVEASEIHFKESPDGIWQDFKENKLDSYNIQPEQLIEFENFIHSKEYAQQVKQGAAIHQLDYVMRRFAYIGWNEERALFKSPKVRQALTMAIDRQRIIKQNLNGMGIETTGSIFPFSPSYDRSIKPWPYDIQRARRLLEEEGWYDSTGDGVIDKMIDGKSVPFRFSLTYYVKNPTTKAIVEYVSTALKELGIICTPNGVDIADLSAATEDRNFDALTLMWGYGSPPEDIRQVWYSTGAKEKGSSNYIGFMNKEVDEITDKLEYEYDPKKRLELYYRFSAIIHQEQPYTFLYIPKTTLLYREYLKNVFIPADRQDLVPGADIPEPDSSIFWLDKKNEGR